MAENCEKDRRIRREAAVDKQARMLEVGRKVLFANMIIIQCMFFRSQSMELNFCLILISSI